MTMTRRQLLLALAGSVAAGRALTPPALMFHKDAFALVMQPLTLGYVDVDRAIHLGIWPADIFLDGVEVKECRAYDDREGYVIAYVLTADGEKQMDPATWDDALVERRNGHVTISPHPEAAINRTWPRLRAWRDYRV